DPVEGVCGADLAAGPADYRSVGDLRGELLRHDRAPEGWSHLCRDLVLHLVRDHDCGPAHREQPGVAGNARALVPGIRGHDGRAGAVVVRAQRRRLLPDDAAARPDVLLPAARGGATGLQLPIVDHPLLGAGLPLHLGGTAPPALLRSPRLGADARDGVQRDAARAVLGRDAERAAHAARRMGPRAYG